MSDTESANQLQSVSHSFQGFVFGFVLVIFSMISLQISSVQFGLSFLPVAALLFWPERASFTWSLLFILILGVLHDVVSFGPLGLRTFCYLLLFIVMGGGVRMKLNFGGAMAGFILASVFVLLVLLMLGRLFLGYWPSWINLSIDGLASLIAFPLVFWLMTLRNAIFADVDRQEAR